MNYNKKTPRLPSEPYFHIQPTSLLQAVDNLPETKGIDRRNTNVLDKVRQRILDVPIESLKKAKMKQPMLEKLPQLAGEQSHQELQERILYIVQRNMPAMRPGVLFRMLPYIIENKKCRKQLKQLFSKRKMPVQAPRWIRDYHQKILQPAAPITALLSILEDNQVFLFDTLEFLEIPMYTPLASQILHRYFASLSQEKLKKQPFAETLRFIESNIELDICQGLLRWMLHRYGKFIQSPFDLHYDEPLTPMYIQAVKLWGAPPSTGWLDFPTEIQRVGTWIWLRREIQRLFGEHDARTTFWLQHIEQITSISSHLPSGVIAVQHVNGIVIEWDTKPRECWIFESQFWVDWLELKWKPGQIRIPEPHKKIMRRGDWQTELQKYMYENHNT